jgi:1-acyl-sn-glycerol-3-phosphate acyltransferase
LPAAGHPFVLVANHLSYLDSLALIDAVPRDLVFVAKRELRDLFWSRVFLRRLDTLFVERFDALEGAQDSAAFAPLLRAGRTLAFFPEGTFRREPGLLPFRMGAFAAAAQAGTPLVPVAILGTRQVLPGDTRVPHRAPVRLVVGPPLRPQGGDWAAAARLRGEARAFILGECGDPDLERRP